MKIPYLNCFVFLSLIFAISACTSTAVKNQDQNDANVNEQLFKNLPLKSENEATQMRANKPVNVNAYLRQIQLIKKYSPSLFNRYKSIYFQVEQWIRSNFSLDKLTFTNELLAGKDGFGRVHLTSYYTPILKARHKAENEYKYPLHAKPTQINGKFPSREQLYNGNHPFDLTAIAYTKSLIDNFMLEVQGSGYVDFENGEPLVFFSFDGKNGYKYSSIGRILVEQGEVRRDQMSMKAIKDWAKDKPESVIINLLKQNKSAVFFKPIYDKAVAVTGAAGIPLIAKTAVASDPKIVPTGSVLLVDVPLLDEKGKYNGKRESRLMVALDVGSAIKGHHLDIYQGIGDKAGEVAGFYTHYGRVWLLRDK